MEEMVTHGIQTMEHFRHSVCTLSFASSLLRTSAILSTPSLTIMRRASRIKAANVVPINARHITTTSTHEDFNGVFAMLHAVTNSFGATRSNECTCSSRGYDCGHAYNLRTVCCLQTVWANLASPHPISATTSRLDWR